MLCRGRGCQSQPLRPLACKATAFWLIGLHAYCGCFSPSSSSICPPVDSRPGRPGLHTTRPVEYSHLSGYNNATARFPPVKSLDKFESVLTTLGSCYTASENRGLAALVVLSHASIHFGSRKLMSLVLPLPAVFSGLNPKSAPGR